VYLFITDNWGSVTGSAWTRSTVNILVQSILFNSRFFLQQSEPNSTWETVIELQSVTSLSAWLPCKRRTEKYWKSVKVCKRNQLYSDDERLYSFLQRVLLFKRDNQNALSSSKVISHHRRERKRRDFFSGTFGPTKNFHHFVWNILKLTNSRATWPSSPPAFGAQLRPPSSHFSIATYPPPTPNTLHSACSTCDNRRTVSKHHQKQRVGSAVNVIQYFL
jgi:hypothetical protein